VDAIQTYYVEGGG